MTTKVKKECVKSLFKKDLNSGDVTNLILRNKSQRLLGFLQNSRMWMMKKQRDGKLPFAISSEGLEDMEAYVQSIEELGQIICESIKQQQEKGLLLFPFGDLNEQEVINYYKNWFVPAPPTKTDIKIREAFRGRNFMTEASREDMTFRETLNEVYGSVNTLMELTRLSDFLHDLRMRTIYNSSNKEIVYTKYQLNKAIADYASEQYNIIVNYIKQHISDKNNSFEGLFPDTLFEEDEFGVFHYNDGYTNALQIFYNYLRLKPMINRYNVLEKGWIDYINQGKESGAALKFYKATNAYINLNYLDQCLNNTFLGYLNIDQTMGLPMILGENDTPTFKYSINKGNVFMSSHWGGEDIAQDALEEMAKFSKILIESIPVWDYATRKPINGYLQSKQFVGCFSLLKSLSSQLRSLGHQELAHYLNNIAINPKPNLIAALNLIFGQNNATLLSTLKSLGFDGNHINYLYSVYRTVYSNRSDSWVSVEDAFLAEHGVQDRYNMVDVISKSITSNALMNYLQSEYDHVEGKWVTKVLDKYNLNSFKFDLVNAINNNIIDANHKILFDGYTLKTIKVNGIPTTRITLREGDEPFVLDVVSKQGLLHKSYSDDNVTIKGLNKFLDEKSGILFDVSSRRRIASGEGSVLENDFLKLMLFIKTATTIDFTTERGLLTLNILLLSNPSALNQIVITAIRAMAVNNIYNQFNNATKKDGTRYSQFEFMEWLEKNPDVYEKEITQSLGSERKRYFMNRFDGTHLNTVLYNTKWIIDLGRINAIMEGDTSRSTVNDALGNKLPNYSPTFQGAQLAQTLEMQHKDVGGAAAHLYFVLHLNAVTSVTVNLDIKTKGNKILLIKSASENELIYDSIVNKFIIPYLNNGDIYTQPTTYSDKTKFLLYLIALKSIPGFKEFSDPDFNNFIENELMSSVGSYYKTIYNKVLNDYTKLFESRAVKDYLNNTNIPSNSEEINNYLKTHTEEDLMLLVDEYNKYSSEKITLYRDLHYRSISGNRLSLNELLYDYSNGLYASKENLHNRLEAEKLKFANDLLKKQVSFQISYYNSKYNFEDAFTKFCDNVLGGTSSHRNMEDWIEDSYLAIGKITDAAGNSRLVTYGNIDLKEGESFQLNPVLNAYFMTDNLIGNNLRYSLTGSEINHKIKSLSKLDLGFTAEERMVMTEVTPELDINNLTLTDVGMLLNSNEFSIYANLQSLTVSEETSERLKLIASIKEKYNAHIYSLENLALNAQFKRNVIIPGTLVPYVQGCVDGILPEMKIAVIDDLQASVFNLYGDGGSIDAHDGAAFINALASKLENNSLLDSEVGTVKKPIHHFYDNRYGTATLLKYAVDTMTNRWMRQSEGNTLDENGISLYDVFKKMTDIRWSENNINVNLSKNGLKDSSMNFIDDILQGNSLYYKNGNSYYKIKNFGYDEDAKAYYTIESEVSYTGDNLNTGDKKIYHYFNENSEHITSEAVRSDLKTIDSLYLLHKVMGGIYSMSQDNEGILQFSETSVNATVNFMINVATKNADGSFTQPLKSAMIDMVASNSSIKNGAGNVNPVSSWKNNKPLRYITVLTYGYGIQMDADHIADMAMMTEFSLVISSLDAGGRLHDYVALIYNTLGKVAMEAAKVELEAIEEFKTEKNISKLYEIVGRTIINNMSKGNDNIGLTLSILNAVERGMNLNLDHKDDLFKLPFSDKNIYDKILQTFVSVLNKKSIKRKYPGTGAVLVPGFNLTMLYEINGAKLQYEDLVKTALREGFTSAHTDLSLKHRDIVKLYLDKIQADHEAEWDKIEKDENENKLPSKSEFSFEFNPEDNIKIKFKGRRFRLENLQGVKYRLVEGEANTVELYEDANSYARVSMNDYGYYSIHINEGASNNLIENLYNIIPDGAKIHLSGTVTTLEETILDSWSEKENNSILIGEVRNVVYEDNPLIQHPSKVIKKGTRETDVDDLVVYVTLDTLDKYYKYTDNTEQAISQTKNGRVLGIKDIRYYKNLIAPRNLKPAQYIYTYVDNNGKEHTLNLWKHWKLKKFIFEKQALDKQLKKKEISKKEYKQKLQELPNRQEVLDQLDKGIYVDENGKEFKIIRSESKAAEIIMSNIYKSLFGLKNGDSLQDVLNNPNYFKSILNLEMKVESSDNYDLIFTKRGGEHQYITFNSYQLSQDSSYEKWGNKVKRLFVYPEGQEPKKGRSRIVSTLYAAGSDNQPLFEIGKEITRPDIEYNKVQKAFIYRVGGNGHSAGDLVENQENFKRLNDSTVVEQIEFVSKFKVKEVKNNQERSFVVYNINKDLLSSTMVKTNYTEDLLKQPDGTVLTREEKYNQELSEYIGNLLTQIYHEDDYSGILVNNTLSETSKTVILNSYDTFVKSLKHNKPLYDYMTKLKEKIVNEKGTIEKGKYKVLPTSKLLKDYIQELSNYKMASFIKSQKFTASRIPALTLLSFMQMENVGFVDVGTNQCYVSHFLTWIQGSDYDIDKAYIMGLAFNNVGIYQGWSNLFDYSSIQSIEQSEYLPMPEGKEYIKADNGFNIDSYIDLIESATTSTLKLKVYCDLLNDLNKQKDKYKKEKDNKKDKTYLVTYTKPLGDEVLLTINEHEATILSSKFAESTMKNFISSHIQNTILNIRNFIGAYSPIEMDEMRSASEQSTKGALSALMTMFNPATKLIMLYLNITGKNVIGIAANGEKASFMWHYYMNEVLNNPDITPEDLNRARFGNSSNDYTFTTERIKGRAEGDPVRDSITTLPEIHFTNASEEIRLMFSSNPTYGLRYRPNTVDLLISLILSCATDNAKELILAKINAGSKLAKMYLFLITVGYDVNDIVKFMTSPMASFIDTISESNTFSGIDISADTAIRMLKHEKTYVMSNILGTAMSSYSKEMKDKLEKFDYSFLDDPKKANPFRKGTANWVKACKAIHFMKSVLHLSPDMTLNDNLKDLEEFERVFKAANEFSTLGTLLGLNQGIATSKIDLQKQLEKFANPLTKAVLETKLDIEVDMHRYFLDEEYREKLISAYDSVKICVNPFELLNKIPHFKALQDILSTVVTVDNNISVKSRVFDLVYKHLKSKGYFLKDSYQENLLKNIDDIFITDFITNSNIKLPHPETNTVTSVCDITNKNEGLLKIKNITNIAEFKYIFENTIIPNLKNGVYYSYENGKLNEMRNLHLADNTLIQSLIRGNRLNLPLYKANLNMMTVNNNNVNREKFQTYLKGLKLLSYYKVGTGSLADLFVIYNLIVNKNLYRNDSLTALFDEFVLQDSSLSIINKYLKYLGELDYDGEVKSNDTGIIEIKNKNRTIKMSVNDLLARTASISSNTQSFNNDPIILLQTEGGYVYYDTKSNEQWNLEVIPKKSGESQEAYLQRFNTYMLYFVLGGMYSNTIDDKINKMRTINADTIQELWKLSRDGIIKITKIC